MKWSTRADWNARPPRNIRTDITPVGLAQHWYGGGSFKRATHAGCLALVKAAQDQHMSDPDINDIMYNLAACHHGFVIECRSTKARPRVRSGANGTGTANGSWYAILALWGQGDGKPADSLLHALRDGIEFMRANAGAGARMSGHRDHTSTACPGDQLYAWARAGAPRPAAPTPAPTPEPEPTPTPTPSEDVMAGVLPAQLVQVADTRAVYAVGFTGAVHVKNPTHLRFLREQGWVTEDIKQISAAELVELLERE